MIGLFDCNNFFASCERLSRPDLEGKPIIVLSSNDGCIIARSNEAKDIGIPMGAPMFKYKDIIAENNINVFPANFTLYEKISNKVMQIATEMEPNIEVYSIDEAFMNVKINDDKKLFEFGEKLYQEIKKSTGITASVGFATSKALAKVANKIAKKNRLQTPVYIINDDKQREEILKNVAVEDIWGIGRQYAKKLRGIGIDKAYDFTQLGDAYLRKEFSVVGLRLKNDLLGKPTIQFSKVKKRRNLIISRTFEKNYTTFEEVRERVVSFASAIAYKLRKQNSCVGSLIVYLMTNRFRNDLKQYYNSTYIQLPEPSNSNFILAEYAERALTSIFREGYYYKRAGVLACNICDTNVAQTALFHQNDFQQDTSAMKAIDLINRRYGNHTIVLASQDIKKKWEMNKGFFTPKYTIEDEIPPLKLAKKIKKYP